MAKQRLARTPYELHGRPMGGGDGISRLHRACRRVGHGKRDCTLPAQQSRIYTNAQNRCTRPRPRPARFESQSTSEAYPRVALPPSPLHSPPPAPSRRPKPPQIRQACRAQTWVAHQGEGLPVCVCLRVRCVAQPCSRIPYMRHRDHSVLTAPRLVYQLAPHTTSSDPGSRTEPSPRARAHTRCILCHPLSTQSGSCYPTKQRSWPRTRCDATTARAHGALQRLTA
jgi:hypothetical protein